MAKPADYLIANGTGQAVLDDLNDVFEAIVTNNADTTAPTTTYPYMLWADTSSGSGGQMLKMRDSGNNNWIDLFTLAGGVNVDAASIFNNNVTFTGNLEISSTNPKIYLTDTDNNSDYIVQNNDGAFRVYDNTNNSQRFIIGADGKAYFTQQLNAQGGLDVTGNIGSTGNLTITNTYPSIFLVDSDNNDDFSIQNQSGVFAVRDETNSANRLAINSDGDVQIPLDNRKLQIGASQDIEIFHNGFNSFFINKTGYLQVKVTNGTTYYDAQDHIFRKADASESMAKFLQNGTVELYFDGTKKFETTSSGVTVAGTLALDQNILPNGYIKVLNDQAIYFGTNNQLNIVANASQAEIITDGTTDLVIKDANHTSAVFDTSAEVQLYHDNSKKFETLSDGVNIIGTLKVNNSAITTGGLGNVVEDTTPQLGGDLDVNTKNINFGNSNGTSTNRAVFGTDGDFEIYKNGSNTTIFDKGTGNLALMVKGSELQLAHNDNAGIYEHMVRCVVNNQVELYWNGNKKFETTSTGALLTGNLAVPSGNGIDFSATADAAGHSSSVLKDYEEGTWTPTLEFNGLTTGITYSARRHGTYTKIGRQVTLHFRFELTNKGTLSDSLESSISGLPYAIANTMNAQSGGSDIIEGEASGISAFWNDVNNTANISNIVFLANDNIQELEIRFTSGPQDQTNHMLKSHFDNDTDIAGTITYNTTS